MKSNIYISRKVLNYQDIVDWARISGFDTMMPEDSLHVTVVYCKNIVDWNLVTRDEPEMILVPEEKEDEEEERAVHEFNGGACVLEIKVPELKKRNEALGKLGIKSGFPDYRAHITITYNKPDDMKVEEVLPYRGPIILGPEVIEPATNDWKKGYEEISLDDVPEHEVELLNEQVNLDIDQLYDIFAASYNETTGKSWSLEKFRSRAANWTFYGDDTGFVAFRQQASGMRKLVGVAGDTSGVVMGLKQVSEDGKPTWGAVSDKLARASKRFGFIAPHLYPGGKFFIKAILKIIPASVFGGHSPQLNDDGSISIEVDEIGNVPKFLIANKEYFTELMRNPLFSSYIKDAKISAFLKRLAS